MAQFLSRSNWPLAASGWAEPKPSKPAWAETGSTKVGFWHCDPVSSDNVSLRRLPRPAVEDDQHGQAGRDDKSVYDRFRRKRAAMKQSTT
jgi:hypothetical protein